MTHILEIDSVILRFGARTVLQDVYLRCETGRVTGILGLNGSGKTCLMRTIMGNLRPEQSFVRIDNHVLTPRSNRRGDIVYMPQRHFIPSFLTIKRVLRDYNVAEDELMSYFPVFKGRTSSLAGELSGGELRLLEFFVVICSDARFAILDEPFSHVMPVNIAVMTEMIKVRSESKGILLSDHLYRPVTDICDDIYIIENGNMHLINDTAEFVRWGYVSKI